MAKADANKIIAQVHKDTCDPIVFGYGDTRGEDDKKPVRRANPLDQPPPFRDRNGNRVYSTVTPAYRDGNATGTNPLFTAGCANERQETWSHDDRLDELFALAGCGDDAPDAAEKVVAQPDLLPRKLTIDAHKVHPSQHPDRANKLRHRAKKLHLAAASQLVLYLIDLDPGVHGLDGMMPAEEDWWYARRLIREATGWELVPRKWAKITLDLDGNGTPAGAHAAKDLGASIILDFYAPHNIPAIIEPSRSRTGAYVTTWIALDGIDTDTFNASLDAFCAMLHKRYGTLADNGDAGVCHVKGKLCEWQHNPSYDRKYAEQCVNHVTGFTQRERYEWKRKHAGEIRNPDDDPVNWKYIYRLEPLILGGCIDFITSPVHGADNDADGGEQRCEDWNWLLGQREHAPTAAQFFDMLGIEPEQVESPAPSKPISLPSPTPSSKPSPSSTITPNYTPIIPNIATIDGQAIYGFDGWKSYLGAAGVALRHTRGDIEQAVHLTRQIREDAGVASGMTEKDRHDRLKSSLHALEYRARTFDISRCGNGTGCSYRVDPDDVAWMLDELPKFVPTYQIRFANEKRKEAKLDMTILSVVLTTLEDTGHDDVGEHGATTRNVVLAAITHYTGKNPHTRTFAAAIELLQDCGLIHITREARPGECRMYEFSRHCPMIKKVRDMPRERQLVAPHRCPEPLPAPAGFPSIDNVRSSIPTTFNAQHDHAAYWAGATGILEPSRAGPGPDPPPNPLHDESHQQGQCARSVLGPLK